MICSDYRNFLQSLQVCHDCLFWLKIFVAIFTDRLCLLDTVFCIYRQMFNYFFAFLHTFNHIETSFDISNYCAYLLCVVSYFIICHLKNHAVWYLSLPSNYPIQSYWLIYAEFSQLLYRVSQKIVLTYFFRNFLSWIFICCTVWFLALLWAFSFGTFAAGSIATFSCCSFIIFHMHFAQTKFFVKTTLCTIAPQ